MAGQSYSKQDLLRMQQEAERRVMEMKERAQSTVHSQSPGQEKKEPVKAPPPHHDDINDLLPRRNGFLDMLNLKSFFKEQDTTLVLLLIVLLSSEEMDPLLMLALLYIIM